MQITGHAQEQSWFPAVHHYLHLHGSSTTAVPESWTVEPPTPIHTRGLGWKSSVAKADSPCEPKSTAVEELGANTGQVGQDGHGGTRGAAQPASMERPSKTETLVPPLSTSGSCGVEPPAYTHRSPKSPGVGCHHLLRHARGTRPRAPQEGEQLVLGRAPSAGCVSPIRNSISRLPVAKGSAAPCAGSARGRGGLVQPRSRDGSQFEFLPKDGQQFT